MLRVIMKNGTTSEVSNGVAAELKGKEVVCYDRRGVTVARYPSDEVIIFGPHLPDADVILSEPVEDSTGG